MNLSGVLDRATLAQWEVFIQHSQRNEIQFRQHDTEAVIQQENTGYGVRVVTPRTNGVGVGFAACNSIEELAATAQKSHELAKFNRSPAFELPTRKKLPPVETTDRKILRDPAGTAKDYAEDTQALMSENDEVSLTFGKIRTYVVDTEIVNSRGLSCKSRGTYAYVELTLKVGRGANPTEFWPTRYARRLSDIAPKRLVKQWIDIAHSSLKRHPPSTKSTTVILSPEVVCDIFVPSISFHSSSEALERHLTQFKVGERVARQGLTVTDDGLYPYGLGTNPFDDEGQPQQKTKLIERGVFKNYIYDQLHAYTLHAKPTGNGIRPKFLGLDVDDRYQTLPSNATTNLSIKPGDQTLEELIRDVKDGILIHHCAWINPDQITTRFGSEIRNGQEIVNGELGEGVVGGTLSGSALDFAQKITGLSNESEIIASYAFGCVAPYVRIENVQISGQS